MRSLRPFGSLLRRDQLAACDHRAAEAGLDSTDSPPWRLIAFDAALETPMCVRQECGRLKAGLTTRAAVRCKRL